MASSSSSSNLVGEKHKQHSTATATTTTTTRVCIKNVPATFSESQLQQHLLQNSTTTSTTTNNNSIIITDCKILRASSTKKSRRTAFVGVKTPAMAQGLIRRFDKTYAGTSSSSSSRLIVEPAFLSKRHCDDDETGTTTTTTTTQLHRQWLKRGSGWNEGSTTRHHDHREERRREEEATEEKKSSSKKKMAVRMGNEASSNTNAPGKTKFWSNDDDGALMSSSVVAYNNDDENKSEKNNEEESKQHNVDTATAAARRTERLGKDDATSDSDDSSNNSSSSSSDDSGGEGADALQSFQRKNRRPSFRHGVAMNMSDMDFLRSKVTAVEEFSEDDEEEEENSLEEELPEDKDKAALDTQENEEESDSDSSSSESSDSSDSSSSSSVDNQDETENPEKTQPAACQDDKQPSKASADENSLISPNRLFVRNLPFAATEEELQEHFSSFGTITSCHIPVDDQKRNKGFAFVSFETSVAAQQAMSELDGTDFQGRLLHILPARKGPNETAQDDTFDESNLTYKQKQDLERRKEASKSSQGWSASFVRGDAVVDNLADRLGLRKGDILNVKEGLSSGDAAVRLALGETHIIEENREYFRKEGVDMDALVSAKGEVDDKSVKRSSTNILVKNLPYDTELEELTKIFYGIGGDPPKRILLPPSRTIAMAEYGHSSDARRAFRKLAYRRFKHVPLYLEWAPLTAQVKDKDEGVISRQDQPSDHAVLEEEKPALDDEDDVDLEPSLSHTIYVKNLNFATTEEELRKIFSKHAKKIRAVKIPTKTAPVKRVRGDKSESPPVKTLSMGFGFVECDSEESVRKAIKALQGAIIDGHALELKRSAKRIDLSSSKKDSPVPGSARKSTKIVVRNVPFQASRKELLQLFGSFGQLKKVRLPKKFDGTHRGFAFVDYLTHQEALTAMNTLSRTHLYGRHLVLEWASDKDDVDTLREKAKRDVSIEAQKPRQNKKIRFN